MILIMSSCNKEGFQGDNVAVSITGSAQKGQFVKGAQLTAFGVDDKLVATGKSFPGNINDDMGNFAISGESVDSYLEARAEGYYFNELTGELSGPLYLEAFLEPSAEKANVNILTTIIRQRLKALIKGGDKYETAVDKAQQEFLTSMGISLDLSSDFVQMDITKSSDADAFLLALSCMVQVDNSPAQITALLQTLADDMEDGALTDENKSLLWEKGKKVSASEVTDNLMQFYQSKGISNPIVPEFWKYLQPSGYAEALSARVIKGMHVYHEREWIIIDTSMEDWAADYLNLNLHGNSVYFQNRSKHEEWCQFNGQFNLSEPLVFYGDYSLEVTVLLKDGASVTSSVPWITVEESESLGDDRYIYTVRVSAEGCKDQREGLLIMGGNEYRIIARNDIYNFSGYDWHVEYLIFDVRHMCHTACESLNISYQKFEAQFNGKEHPLHVNEDISHAFMLEPREYVYEAISADEDREIEIKCMSLDGVSVGYVTDNSLATNGMISPELRELYAYLAMRCPFVSIENNFTPSPLNRLTIEGKEYEPCALSEIYCLYAVEREKLQPGVSVMISNAQHGNGTGVIEQVGIHINMGFSSNYSVQNIQM
jgi:hypothetical protein